MADTVESDSKYRVAYDLMNKIAGQENGAKDRKYYLTLYAQCSQVVIGRSTPDELHPPIN